MTEFALNGDMAIDQPNEGEEVRLPHNSGAYCCDGWRGLRVSKSPSIITVQRVKEGPRGLPYSLKTVVHSAASAIDAGDYLCLHSMLSGDQMQKLAYGTPQAQTSSVAFLARSNIPGIFGFNLANIDGSRTIVRTFTLPEADQWTEVKLENISGCTDGHWSGEGKLWGFMVFFACCGSTYQAPEPNRWHTSDYGSTVEQTNRHLLEPGSYFQITGVRHVIGPAAKAFEPMPKELKRCQQTYEKSYPAGIKPGAPTGRGIGYGFGKTAKGVANVSHSFASTKIRNPDVVIYSPLSGTANAVHNIRTGKDMPGTLVSVDKRGFTFSVAGVEQGAELNWHWSADARLKP